MATGEEIGKDYPTLMPALTDEADIQEAFTMYHYGLTSYTGIETIPEDSIEGHLGAANARITALEGRPVAGGIVSPDEPTQTGTPPQAIPEGYIWVDGDAIDEFNTDFPTVFYGPGDPSASLTMANVGTLWVDEDGSASGSPSYKPSYVWNGSSWDLIGNQPTVDKFNEYALLNPNASANQEIVNTNFDNFTTEVNFNQQASTSYTLSLSDRDKVVELNNASPITLTVPTNESVEFPIGTSLVVVQTGTGQVTVTGDSGVTVNSNPGLKLSGQWASAALIKRSTDTWLLMGNTAS